MKVRCCICGKPIKNKIRDANNPDPLKDEQGHWLSQLPEGQNVCCHECDMDYVTNYRINQFYGHPDVCIEIQNKVLELRKEWLNKDETN